VEPTRDRERAENERRAVMTIVYALIARGKAVLAEYTATAGNFPTVTRVLLNKIPAENTRMSYVSTYGRCYQLTVFRLDRGMAGLGCGLTLVEGRQAPVERGRLRSNATMTGSLIVTHSICFSHSSR